MAESQDYPQEGFAQEPPVVSLDGEVASPAAEPSELLLGVAEAGEVQPESVRSRMKALHREILRRTFLGENAREISQALGLQHSSVRFIVTSPLFRAALQEMQVEADKKVLDTATRIKMERELEAAASEGIPIAVSAMRDSNLNGMARAKIAFGFLDRVGLGPTRKIEHQGDSYREILERLDELERHDEGVERSAPQAGVVEEASVTFSVRREAGRASTVTSVAAHGAHAPESEVDTSSEIVSRLKEALGGG